MSEAHHGTDEPEPVGTAGMPDAREYVRSGTPDSTRRGSPGSAEQFC
jgi:hypothetical protein